MPQPCSFLTSKTQQILQGTQERGSWNLQSTAQTPGGEGTVTETQQLQAALAQGLPDKRTSTSSPQNPVLSTTLSPIGLDHRPRPPIPLANHIRGASLPFSCWKQEALLSGSRGCLRTPLLGLGLSYSLSGSMACSLSMAGSECGGRDCGNPNIKREEKKSKAPQSRKPPHQAPIQRGSSGVMSRLPATRKKTVSRMGGDTAGLGYS